MRILFLTDNFPPEVNAPASRTFENCREFIRAGHDVIVVTCAPNFPKGRVFEGYRNAFWQEEVLEGIRVVRVWSFMAPNEGFLLRSIDYLSYALSAVLVSPFVGRVDVVVGTSPQFFTACAAYLASRLKRAPFVFELRDLWPESIRAVGALKDGALLSALDRLEEFLYTKSDAIVSVTHSFKENLVGRGVDPRKIHVVTNGVDRARFSPRVKDQELLKGLGFGGKFVAGYIGTHGMAHALNTLLDAAALLLASPWAEHFQLLFLGDGAKKGALEQEARQRRLSNVTFLPSVPKDQVTRYWSILDASIIHLKNTGLFRAVIPSKVFESIGMGIPILHGVRGESADIVRRTRVGLTFEPENARQLVAALLCMAQDEERYRRMQEACRTAAAMYDRSRLAKELLAILRRVYS